MQKPSVESLVAYFEALAAEIKPDPGTPCHCNDHVTCHGNGMAYGLRRAAQLLKDTLNTGDSGA